MFGAFCHSYLGFVSDFEIRISRFGFASRRRPPQVGSRMATRGAFSAAGALVLAALWLGACNGSGPAGPAPSAQGTAPETLVTPTGVEMVLVPAGRFVMGSEEGEQDEAPPRTVEIGAFLMDTSEVTQESYRRLMGRNPSKFQGPDRPVERLSYFGAVQYCNMRSLREKLTPCYNQGNTSPPLV